MHYRYLESPIGTLRLCAGGGSLRAIEFEGHYTPGEPDDHDDPILADCARQLEQYFAGELRQFDLPLEPGGTAFQRAVWRALADIPYGQVCSYRDIARRLDKPGAVRAVGAANGRNPLPLVVPCHRVIGSDGSLTGYAGGLAVKTKLLELEGALASAPG